MIACFRKVGFLSATSDQNELRSWNRQRIKVEFVNFCNSADEFLRRELWMQLAADGSKYAFLLHVHPAFGMADIGFMDLDWSLRRKLVKFLCSSHNLEIETGRYQRPPKSRDERFCLYCLQNGETRLGDEWHALDSCPKFEECRKIAILQICKVMPDVSLSTCVVSNVLQDLDRHSCHTRHKTWKAIAVFVAKIMELMKSDGRS